MGDSIIRLTVDDEAKAFIDKHCRQRGMTRAELMVRATLAFCGASPFSEAEEEQIRKLAREEMSKSL